MNYTQIYLEMATVKDPVVNDAAVCALEKSPNLQYFPHAMQQIFPCISYWKDHTDHQPILILTDRPKVQHAFQFNPFLKGIIDVLKSEIGLQVVTMSEYVASHPESSNSIQSFKSMDRGYVTGGCLQDLNTMVQNYQDRQPNHASGSKMDCTRPRVAILNRQGSRRILNAAEMALAISALLDHYENEGAMSIQKNRVSVFEFEGASFQEQVNAFQQTDILISGHGAQLTGLGFLANKPCSHLLELFPHTYAIPSFFGSLASQAQVQHSFLYFPGDNVLDQKIVLPWDWITSNTLNGRLNARRAQFCPSIDVMVDTVIEVISDWNSCCKAQLWH
jgi:hypothetical protein